MQQSGAYLPVSQMLISCNYFEKQFDYSNCPSHVTLTTRSKEHRFQHQTLGLWVRVPFEARSQSAIFEVMKNDVIK
jgi:hypothetical protein